MRSWLAFLAGDGVVGFGDGGVRDIPVARLRAVPVLELEGDDVAVAGAAGCPLALDRVVEELRPAGEVVVHEHERGRQRRELGRGAAVLPPVEGGDEGGPG